MKEEFLHELMVELTLIDLDLELLHKMTLFAGKDFNDYEGLFTYQKALETRRHEIYRMLYAPDSADNLTAPEFEITFKD